MNRRTKKIIMNIIKAFHTVILLLGLSSCGSSGKTVEANKTSGFQQNHGPFDSNGNYVESWADSAPKRKYVWKKSTSKKPTIPPKKTTSSSSTYKPKKTTSSSSYKPKKTYTPAPAVKKPYTPKKTYTPTPTVKKPTPKKITPKAKPPIIHTVRKGDTLYGIARAYAASISDIQQVNGITNNSISIGTQLIIPRK